MGQGQVCTELRAQWGQEAKGKTVTLTFYRVQDSPGAAGVGGSDQGAGDAGAGGSSGGAGGGGCGGSRGFELTVTEAKLQRMVARNSKGPVITAQVVSCPPIHLRIEVAVEEPAEAPRQEVRKQQQQVKQEHQHVGQAGGQGGQGDVAAEGNDSDVEEIEPPPKEVLDLVSDSEEGEKGHVDDGEGEGEEEEGEGAATERGAAEQVQAVGRGVLQGQAQRLAPAQQQQQQPQPTGHPGVRMEGGADAAGCAGGAAAGSAAGMSGGAAEGEVEANDRPGPGTQGCHGIWVGKGWQCRVAPGWVMARSCTLSNGIAGTLQSIAVTGTF